MAGARVGAGEVGGLVTGRDLSSLHLSCKGCHGTAVSVVASPFRACWWACPVLPDVHHPQLNCEVGYMGRVRKAGP